ncbi:MAG: lipid-A-disaccharide synthase N-terminal domain-containing protein [Bacteroidota bacterium]
MQWLGYMGLVALVVAWIPQSVETVKLGRCSINLEFLVLVLIGNVCLALYAWSIDDTVFGLLNSVSTVGVVLNIYYKLLPRKTDGSTGSP